MNKYVVLGNVIRNKGIEKKCPLSSSYLQALEILKTLNIYCTPAVSSPVLGAEAIIMETKQLRPLTS